MDNRQEHVVWVQGWDSEETNDHHSPANTGRISKVLKNIRGVLEPSIRKTRATGETRIGTSTFRCMNVVLDPQNSSIRKWNNFFLLVSAISSLVDPLYLYIPVIDGNDNCLGDDKSLETAATVLRSTMDAIYIGRMILQFHIGFWGLSLESGTRVLVEDSWVIARRYLSSSFLIDILAVLPFPQVAIWFIIPRMTGSRILNTKNVLKCAILIQLAPRFIRIKNLYQEIARTSSVLLRASRTVASINLFLYIYAGHVIGALWYLFSLERQLSCWQDACQIQEGCIRDLLYCDKSSGHHDFQNFTYFHEHCSVDGQGESAFDFGIFSDALKSNVVQSRSLLLKVLYCFWWALQNLSSLGQNLKTSTYIWEIFFAVNIFVWGLVLFSLLIGIMQTRLLSSTNSSEEIKTRWQNVEEWMSSNCLPENLRKRMRRHERYRLQETRGVDIEDFLHKLPKDLRRETKHHLGLALLRRAPLLANMDGQLLDAMCDRLKPAFYPEDCCIVREGDPVDEMVFIVRGNLLTSTSGITGFHIKAGEYCGGQLFTWALDPNSSSNLPIATRTIRTITKVEAFALVAEDLKFVASRLRPLQRKQLARAVKFYSPQWRTWASCYIQAAWRRYQKKKLEESLRQEENRLQHALAEASGSSPSLGATIYASRFATKLLRTLQNTGTCNTKIA